MRVGILGGTFDPPHIGHIELARFVLDNIPAIDEIWLMPAFTGKLGKKISSFHDRYVMCEKAVKGYPRIKVSNFEHSHAVISTFDLCNKLHIAYSFLNIYMIIGMDCVNSINQWHRSEELIKLYKFIAVSRAGYSLDNKWCLEKPHLTLYDNYNIIPEISSTVLRHFNYNELDNNISEYYLKSSVISYIKERKLYE